jgi:hypothetical protein
MQRHRGPKRGWAVEGLRGVQENRNGAEGLRGVDRQRHRGPKIGYEGLRNCPAFSACTNPDPDTAIDTKTLTFDNFEAAHCRVGIKPPPQSVTPPP